MGPMVLPIALWCTPRSASTAFDRMMRERADHSVFTEPFAAAYYDGPDRVSTRFDVLDGGQGAGPTYAAVWAELDEAARQEPVFVKEMAHHLGPALHLRALERFESTFLIRDPMWAVPSMLAIWPDATDEELGYEAQHRAFELLRGSGHAPPVLDSDDVRSDPHRYVGLWCEAVGIDHRPDALSWEPGLPHGWERWADWFSHAAASTGFAPPEASPPTVDPQVAGRIERCREHYEALRAHRLT